MPEGEGVIFWIAYIEPFIALSMLVVVAAACGSSGRTLEPYAALGRLMAAMAAHSSDGGSW
jgi:hypothetical protein